MYKVKVLEYVIFLFFSKKLIQCEANLELMVIYRGKLEPGAVSPDVILVRHQGPQNPVNGFTRTFLWVTVIFKQSLFPFPGPFLYLA
jgi:hypothetical protein